MTQVKDVICGMMMDSATTQFKSEYKGQTYYFCSASCKAAFDQNPAQYAQQAQAGVASTALTFARRYQGELRSVGKRPQGSMR